MLAFTVNAAFAQTAESIKAREMQVQKNARTDSGLRELSSLKNKKSSVSAKDIQRERERQIQLVRFGTAVSAFESAREDLADAFGLNAKLSDPARKLAKSTDALLDFLKQRTKESPRFDPSELHDVTLTELGREALASAKLLSPQLAAMLQIETAESVDIQYLLSMQILQKDLLRLQWIAQKLK